MRKLSRLLSIAMAAALSLSMFGCFAGKDSETQYENEEPAVTPELNEETGSDAKMKRTYYISAYEFDEAAKSAHSVAPGEVYGDAE